MKPIIKIRRALAALRKPKNTNPFAGGTLYEADQSFNRATKGLLTTANEVATWEHSFHIPGIRKKTTVNADEVSQMHRKRTEVEINMSKAQTHANNFIAAMQKELERYAPDSHQAKAIKSRVIQINAMLKSLRKNFPPSR